jgi:hypothetical protein
MRRRRRRAQAGGPGPGAWHDAPGRARANHVIKQSLSGGAGRGRAAAADRAPPDGPRA